ncbi:hypothetical protein K523DRAFT_392413 [Schizophyllum commune Tattone D]|nr:hypothetical protein K523DRAFT_392413 [Schizophyllum commune Tattone D]
MIECEEYCHASDLRKERLYFATGYGLIQCVKALMSYEDEDLLAGIQHTKHGNHIAQLHRKKQPYRISRLAGLVLPSFSTSGVDWVRSMTPVERHAELTYAESLFEKTILGIVYSGDWLALVTEILNMRSLFNIYRQLGRYIDAVDAEGHSKTIDVHFRSGVYLGVGLSHLILSLMPSKILSIVELFGYHGDRQYGLELLQKAGGWEKGKKEPGVNAASEGVRRPICDMALLIFHLVASSVTFDGVDVKMAEKILEWNLKRYPNGVFFLFGAGRLALIHSQPRRAIDYYTRAMEAQKQYRNLHHISHWEIALAHLSLWDLDTSLEYWELLEADATWSKAIYSYGLAVCLLESADAMEAKVKEGGDATAASKEEPTVRRERAMVLMGKVPGLRQRIAGKSIPLEKLVARKARRYAHDTRHRPVLPALELAYLFLGIAHAPREVLVKKMLPEVWAAEQRLGVESITATEKAKEVGLNTANPSPDNLEDRAREYGKGYWDDVVLARFLEGVCLRYVAYPDPDAIVEDVTPDNDVPEAAEKARAAFADVFKYGPRVELDHHLVYHAHYELGRLLACMGDIDGARKQFDLVLSGRHLEVNAAGRRGRYSMEKALMMRTHAAMEALDKQRL